MSYNPNIVPVMPDTAMSVLELFSTSKESCMRFANQVIDEVKEGRADALRVKALIKSMEQIIESIDKNTKTEQANQAAKFGEHPFPFAGCEMHYTPTYTTYDYGRCNDPEYFRLTATEKDIAEKRKARETFLRGLPAEGMEFLDKESGEVFSLLPPLKKQIFGVKVTIR